MLLISAVQVRDLASLRVAGATVGLHWHGSMLWIALRKITASMMAHLIDGLVVLGRLLMVAGRAVRHGIVPCRISSLLLLLHHRSCPSIATVVTLTISLRHRRSSSLGRCFVIASGTLIVRIVWRLRLRRGHLGRCTVARTAITTVIWWRTTATRMLLLWHLGCVRPLMAGSGVLLLLVVTLIIQSVHVRSVCVCLRLRVVFKKSENKNKSKWY